MQNEKINPEQAHTTLMIVWFALVMSQLLFLVILYFIKPGLFRFDLTQPLLGENAVVVGALAAIAIVNLVTSFTLRKRYIGQAIATGSIAMVQSALIVGCALCESISLFGLLLGFAFDYPYFFAFSIVGIVGTLLHFPRRGDIHAASFKPGL